MVLGRIGGVCFEPLAEQCSHDNEREKSESAENAANDGTYVVGRARICFWKR